MFYDSMENQNIFSKAPAGTERRTPARFGVGGSEPTHLRNASRLNRSLNRERGKEKRGGKREATDMKE
jgi:hypothetical protein